MWPERRLKLLVPPDAIGLEGFKALLEILGLGYSVEWENITREQSLHNLGENVEQNLEQRAQEFGEPIITDLICWPGLPGSKQVQSVPQKPGVSVTSLTEFLERVWQAEHILTVDPPYVCLGEKPLLWVILHRAGFAPSLLWGEEGQAWQEIRGEGTVWIVPGSWLKQVSGEKPPGQRLKHTKITWEIRPESLDFYETGEPLKFRGSLPRWTQAHEEQGFCQAVAQALGLGVSWSDVRRTLGYEQSKQGWLTDDFGRTQRPDRERLSPPEINDMENRRAG